jgi:hypothetical protein
LQSDGGHTTEGKVCNLEEPSEERKVARCEDENDGGGEGDGSGPRVLPLSSLSVCRSGASLARHLRSKECRRTNGSLAELIEALRERW